MSLTTLTDTICALSTPLGTSALATLRLSGADAIVIAAKCLQSPERLITALGGESIYSTIKDITGGHIDDVVLSVWRAPRSYTGEDIVEFHTHGSPVITDLLQRQLIAHGARLAEAGEFSRRAFMNGKQSLQELERTLMRLDASSEDSLSKIEPLLQAKFDRLREVYDDCISLLAQVNAEIDFGESDQVELSGFAAQMGAIRHKLSELVARSVNQQLNKGYFSVVLTGPPNVGKSSLFNALIRYERSIVSDIAGTTRDYIEAFVMLEGFKVKIIDTAGLRDSADSIESRGIALGKDIAEKADIELRMTDPATRSVRAATGQILVHNKCDLDGFSDGIAISTVTGQGMKELISLIKNEIAAIDQGRTSYNIAETELATIESVRQRLNNSLINKELSLIAEDLRFSADAIASLLGFRITDDNLNYIFTKMCIGK